MENKTTSTGKQVKNATLKTDRGSTFDKVSIWSDFPGWSELAPGREVEGEIRTNAKGYKSLSPATAPATYTRPPSGAVSAAKITSESVKEAQANKNASIAYFNAINSAITFVSSFKSEFEIMTGDEYFQKVLEYRDKFLGEWRKYESGDTTDKTRPF